MARKAGLRGNPGLLKQLGAKLTALPKTVQAEVAREGAPILTGLAQQAFDGGQTVYGEGRPASTVDGAPLSLEASGAVRRSLYFVANGTQIRCVFGPKHMRYLVGKYKILPNNALPFLWRRVLGDVVKRAADRAVAQAMAGVGRKSA